jgi:hypothetical protein
MIIDEDCNIIVKPFDKIFNRGEQGTDIPRDARCIAVRKVNGFMAAATWHPRYGVIISTTGSLDSKFVDMAKSHLCIEFMPYLNTVKTPMHTWLFEVVDKEDPHIIKEAPGVYLLNVMNVASGFLLGDEYHLDELCRNRLRTVKRPEWFEDRFSGIVESAKTARHEGFVVYADSGKVLKLKSPFYLLSKLFGRMKEEKLLKCLEDKNMMFRNIDEEFYPVFDWLRTIKDEFVKMDEQTRIATVQAHIESLY